MDVKFKHVPDEVKRLKDSGIFDISYTHATSNIARFGINKTGKIMSPRVAIANGIVPFSGECLWGTYLFRAYHVSVSEYPEAIDGHNWHRYINYGMGVWTPEISEQSIFFFEEEKKRIVDQPKCLADFYCPSRKKEIEIKIDGCIEIEKLRQERYKELSEKEKINIENPLPEVYVFDSNLRGLVSRRYLFGKPLSQVSHPFAPAEINLKRYLTGIFTSLDVDETKAWISRVVRKEIPVGSLDALATWEEINGIKNV